MFFLAEKEGWKRNKISVYVVPLDNFDHTTTEGNFPRRSISGPLHQPNECASLFQECTYHDSPNLSDVPPFSLRNITPKMGIKLKLMGVIIFNLSKSIQCLPVFLNADRWKSYKKTAASHFSSMWELSFPQSHQPPPPLLFPSLRNRRKALLCEEDCSISDQVFRCSHIPWAAPFWWEGGTGTLVYITSR